MLRLFHAMNYLLATIRSLFHTVKSLRATIESLFHTIESLFHAMESLRVTIKSLLHAFDSLFHTVESLRANIMKQIHAMLSPSYSKDLVLVSESLELYGISAKVKNKHGPLFTYISLIAYLGLHEKMNLF